MRRMVIVMDPSRDTEESMWRAWREAAEAALEGAGLEGDLIRSGSYPTQTPMPGEDALLEHVIWQIAHDYIMPTPSGWRAYQAEARRAGRDLREYMEYVTQE